MAFKESQTTHSRDQSDQINLSSPNNEDSPNIMIIPTTELLSSSSEAVDTSETTPPPPAASPAQLSHSSESTICSSLTHRGRPADLALGPKDCPK